MVQRRDKTCTSDRRPTYLLISTVYGHLQRNSLYLPNDSFILNIYVYTYIHAHNYVLRTYVLLAPEIETVTASSPPDAIKLICLRNILHSDNYALASFGAIVSDMYIFNF